MSTQYNEDFITNMISEMVKKQKISYEAGQIMLINGMIGTLLTTPDYKLNLITKDIVDILPSVNMDYPYLQQLLFRGGAGVEERKSDEPDGEAANDHLVTIQTQFNNNSGSALSDSRPTIHVLNLFDAGKDFQELRDLKKLFNDTNVKSLYKRLNTFITGKNSISKYTFLISCISFLESISFFYTKNIDGFTSSTIIFLLSAVVMQFQTDEQNRKKIIKHRKTIEQEIERKVDKIASTFRLYNSNRLESPSTLVRSTSEPQLSSITKSSFELESRSSTMEDTQQRFQMDITKEEAIERLLNGDDLLLDGIKTITIQQNIEEYTTNNNQLYDLLRNVVNSYFELMDRYNKAREEYREPNGLTDDFIENHSELSEKVNDLIVNIGKLFILMGKGIVTVSKVTGKVTFILSKVAVSISIQTIRFIHFVLRETGLYPYVIGGTFLWITRQQVAYPVIKNAIGHFLKSTVANQILATIETKLSNAATAAMSDIAMQAAEKAAAAAAEAAKDVVFQAVMNGTSTALTSGTQAALTNAATTAALEAAETVAGELAKKQIENQASNAIINGITNFVSNPSVLQTLTNGATGLLQLTNGGKKKNKRTRKRNHRKKRKRTRRNR
jgi:hypothetical protein